MLGLGARARARARIMVLCIQSHHTYLPATNMKIQAITNLLTFPKIQAVGGCRWLGARTLYMVRSMVIIKGISYIPITNIKALLPTSCNHYI